MFSSGVLAGKEPTYKLLQLQVDFILLHSRAHSQESLSLATGSSSTCLLSFSRPKESPALVLTLGYPRQRGANLNFGENSSKYLKLLSPNHCFQTIVFQLSFPVSFSLVLSLPDNGRTNNGFHWSVHNQCLVQQLPKCISHVKQKFIFLLLADSVHPQSTKIKQVYLDMNSKLKLTSKTMISTQKTINILNC